MTTRSPLCHHVHRPRRDHRQSVSPKLSTANHKQLTRRPGAAVEALSALEPAADGSGEGGTQLTIGDCASILNDAHLGDSISVDGTCLTVTSFGPSQFTIGVAPETLRRTTLGRLGKGDRVNLERAARADTRLGGHLVQGHVDTVAEIAERRPDGEAVVLRLAPRDRRVLRYVIEKGYVALDGASLTVTAVNLDADGGWFEIMLIAYTQERIALASKRVGAGVNVEVDQVGKYVENCVQGYFEDKQREGGGPAVLERMVERIIDAKLAKSRSS